MIKTGKAPISVMTYIAIMSISLIVNLPGLAVAPMEGTLKGLLHASELEVQLLTTLPNFLIIPFVLLSGKLSLAKHKIPIIVGGLVLYSACAVAYLFADTMLPLIIISCLLGCGAGLLIPFAAGLIADCFVGKYRMKQMGWKSGISNSSVVIATFAVGWLIKGSNWHLPFVVYLVALIPLAFCFWLRKVPGLSASSHDDASSAQNAVSSDQNTTSQPSAPQTSVSNSSTTQSSPGIPHKEFNTGRIWGLIVVYFLITFTSICITNYCSQLCENYKWSSTVAGGVTAVYFLFILLPGYCLPFFVKVLRGGTFFWTALMLVVGIGLFVFVHQVWAMYVGALLSGLGYGICQPLVYDKASHTVSNPAKYTLALAFVLTANYLAIAIEPFVISGCGSLLHLKNYNIFAFEFSLAVTIAYAIFSFFLRKKFAFSIDTSYYS